MWWSNPRHRRFWFQREDLGRREAVFSPLLLYAGMVCFRIVFCRLVAGPSVFVDLAVLFSPPEELSAPSELGIQNSEFIIPHFQFREALAKVE